MKDIPITQRNITSTRASISVQGAGTGQADSYNAMAAFTRKQRDKVQETAYDNAYLDGQTKLESGLTSIEAAHANDPGALKEALEEYQSTFIGDVTDRTMAARFNLQIEKSKNSALARATSRYNTNLNDTARFENLQAFDSIQNEVRRLAGDMVSNDPLVAEAAKQKFQEVTARAGMVMEATDTDGAPLFGASTRFNQLANLSDIALEGAAMRWFESQPNKSEALKTWQEGGVKIQMPSMGDETADIASNLMSDLQQEVGVSPAVAAGIVGNLAHESGGFKTLQEIDPTVKGSRGGYGFAQWTGPRRKAFEKWSKDNGLDPSSYEANKGFLVHELKNTPEGSVLNKMAGIEDPQEAAQVFSNEFLRPGIPHMEKRIAWTSRILNPDVEVIDVRESVSPQTSRMIETEAKRQISAEEAQVKQQRDLASSQLDLAIETAVDDEQMSRTQKLQRVLQEVEDNPLYNDSPDGVIKGNKLREKVFKKLDDEREKFESVSLGTAFAGGEAYLNRADPKAVKAFDDYYEAIEPNLGKLTPQERNVAMVELVNNAKAVPKRLKGDLQRIARSRDTDQMINAADFMQRVSDKNPHLLGDLGDPRDLARIDMVNDRIEIGYNADEAMKTVDELLDPRNDLTLAEATAELKEKGVDYTDKAKNLFDSSYLPMYLGLDNESMKAKEQITYLGAAYRTAYEDHYKITRDQTQAHNFAERMVKGRFSVSNINGGNTLMQDPPENHYGIPGLGNEWMREQMIEDAQGFFKNSLSAGGEKYGKKDLDKNLILVSDHETRRTATGGKPTYLLMYKKDDGTLLKVGDNRYFFDPDKVRSKLRDEAQARVDSFKRIEEAKEQYGKFSLQADLIEQREDELRTSNRPHRIDALDSNIKKITVGGG